MKNKIISIVLTVVMACLCLPASVPAAEEMSEPIHLIWWVYSSGNVPNDLDKVLEKANAISSERIGVTVEMEFKDESQFTLDMTAGEYYDMTFTCDWCNDFDKYAMQGYFRDITDMVSEAAPELYAAVDPWWEIGTLNGAIYGVPMLKDLGAEVFFRLNSDYFEGEKGLELDEKPETLYYKEPPHFKDLSPEEKNALIAEDPTYGRVICRCESITEGEMRDAMRSPIPPRSVDAIKRRTMAGQGRCQGGFCGPQVVKILSQNLGIPEDKIPQNMEGSWMLINREER